MIDCPRRRVVSGATPPPEAKLPLHAFAAPLAKGNAIPSLAYGSRCCAIRSCRSGNPVTPDIFQTDLYLVREIGYHRSRKNGHSSDWRNVSEIKIAELFAGVGGFRLGLEGYEDPKHPEF